MNAWLTRLFISVRLGVSRAFGVALPPLAAFALATAAPFEAVWAFSCAVFFKSERSWSLPPFGAPMARSPALQQGLTEYLRGLASGRRELSFAAQGRAVEETWRALVASGDADRVARREGWSAVWRNVGAVSPEFVGRDVIEMGWEGLVLEVERTEARLPAPASGTEEALLRARFGVELLRERLRSLFAYGHDLVLLPTADPIGMQDANEASPYPVFAIGFVDQPVELAGVYHWPVAYSSVEALRAQATFMRSFARAVQATRSGEWSWGRFQIFVGARARVYDGFRRLARDVRSERVRFALEAAWRETFVDPPLRDPSYAMSRRGLIEALDGLDPRGFRRGDALEARIRNRADAGHYGPEGVRAGLDPRSVSAAIESLREYARGIEPWLDVADPP